VVIAEARVAARFRFFLSAACIDKPAHKIYISLLNKNASSYKPVWFFNIRASFFWKYKGDGMSVSDLTKKSIDSFLWQDYRGSNSGMVVVYDTDPLSELPIREVPEDSDSLTQPEPHYESGTYGVYGCVRPKIRGAFFKAKLRYMLFMTKYTGTKEEFKNAYFITGFYRIFKSANLQKLHVRYLTDSSCFDLEDCIAFRADEVHFVTIEDAFALTKDVLKSWEFDSKITKQTRILLNPEQVEAVVSALRAKPNQRESYSVETRRLMPRDLIEDAESLVLEDADDVPVPPLEQERELPAVENPESTPVGETAQEQGNETSAEEMPQSAPVQDAVQESSEPQQQAGETGTV
jgi:hypothetical protein